MYDAQEADSCLALSAMSMDALKASSPYYESISLYINPHSFRSARLACGGVVEMCLSVARGEIRNGFACVRPPGHHAEPDLAMGFCLLNNAAVAAKVAIKECENVKKVMILDWSVGILDA